MVHHLAGYNQPTRFGYTLSIGLLFPFHIFIYTYVLNFQLALGTGLGKNYPEGVF